MNKVINPPIVKLFLLFFVPLIVANTIGENNIYSMLFSLLSAVTLTHLFYSLRPSTWLTRISKVLLVLSYLVLLFFVLFKSILFDFTGKGFTDEVYYHMDWQSFTIGFKEYLWPMIGLIVVAITYVLIAVFINTKNHAKPSFKHLSITAFFYLLLLWFSPINAFMSGLIEYHNQSNRVELSSSQIDSLVEGGFINPIDIPKKHAVTATNTQNTNLILIYLESFNQFLVDHPDFKYLTPNLNKLSKKYTAFDHQNSSFVTIEGLISSMCGTFLPLQAGNDTFMKKSDAMADLPCLGDILQQAGYQQYFLGGAKMEFAGKGDFLSTHGYQNVRGMEYWEIQGKSSTQNIWGLSDSDLLNEAIKTIKEAAKNPPYNLTLLTLGTHIPGYVYEGCESITIQDPFLAAISCTDLLIGNFIRTLEQENLLDNTLFLIVADHGVFPNPAMTQLFGEAALDRRLVGITNFSENIPQIPISSYDLAPVILQWLGISHDAKFLFGRTVDEKLNQNHKHVTRYRDWVDGKPIKVTKGECRTSLTGVNLLNQCEKSALYQLTQEVLDRFSKQDFTEILACELTANIDLSATVKQISINGTNHYYDFYHNGRFMDVRKFQTGYFSLVLNKKNQLIEKKYHSLKSGKIEDILSTILSETKDLDKVLVFRFNDSNTLTVFNENSTILYETKTQPIEFSLDICGAAQ